MTPLNCNPGDMAFIIKSDIPDNLGKIVTCITQIGTPSEFDVKYPKGKNLWLIDQEVEWKKSLGATVFYPYVPDHCLKPIRYDDGKDVQDITVKDLAVETF